MRQLVSGLCDPFWLPSPRAFIFLPPDNALLHLPDSDSNNGHMIKFDFYDTASSYQCHFTSLGAYVVSIAHYMRAHFNRQALLYGSDFRLPGDAGYLNVSTTGIPLSDELSFR